MFQRTSITRREIDMPTHTKKERAKKLAGAGATSKTRKPTDKKKKKKRLA